MDFVLSTIAFRRFSGITSQELVFSLSDVGSDMTKGSGVEAVMPLLSDPFLVWRGICTKKN